MASFIRALFKASRKEPTEGVKNDNVMLQQMGYTQELYRGFNLLMNFAVTCREGNTGARCSEEGIVSDRRMRLETRG